MSRVLILLLLVALAGIFPLASAVPADTVWIPGLYDAADYDDVAGLVTSTEARQMEIVSAPRRPAVVVGPPGSPATASLHSAAPRSTLRLRSPPRA